MCRLFMGYIVSQEGVGEAGKEEGEKFQMVR